jgi:hypothetical protein
MPAPSVTYVVAQGATLDVLFNVYVDGLPANTSGAIFRSTLKPSAELPDDHPTTIMIDWGGGATKVLGQERWLVSADITQKMAPHTWVAQIRGENIPGLPLVSDVLEPIVIVTQPVSTRFEGPAEELPPPAIIGPPGPPGPQGPPGRPGSKWFSGPINPVVVPDAIPGDYYLNVISGEIFTLSAGMVWVRQ